VGPGKITTSLVNGRIVTEDGFSPWVTAQLAIQKSRLLTSMSKTGGFVIVEIELHFGTKPYPIIPVRPDDDLGETAKYIESVYQKAISKRQNEDNTSQGVY
jgi:hypothetical protein